MTNLQLPCALVAANTAKNKMTTETKTKGKFNLPFFSKSNK